MPEIREKDKKSRGNGVCRKLLIEPEERLRDKKRLNAKEYAAYDSVINRDIQEDDDDSDDEGFKKVVPVKSKTGKEKVIGSA